MEKKLEVCRVCPYYYTQKKNLDSGLKPYYFNLILNLNKLNVNNTVITLDTDSEQNVFLIETRKKFSYLLFGYDVYKKIKSLNKKFDIIHTHQANPFLLYFFKSKINSKFVHTIHGSPVAYKKVPLRSFSNFKDMLYSYLFNMYICKKADAIIAVSSEGRDEIIKYFKILPEKVYFVPTGFDPLMFKPVKSKKSIDLLYVGRFAIKKNIPLLIYITKELKKEFPNIKVCLIGGVKTDADYDLILNKIKEYNLSDNVEIKLSMPQDELIEYYNKSKLFILLSFEEGLPKVLIEAMASGLPAIAANNSGMKDVIINGENGFLVDLDNKNEIINKIRSVLNNESKLKVDSKSMQKFSWNSAAKQILELYKKL